MQGLGNHHIAVEIKGTVDGQVLHHQAEKCGIRNMGQAAILAEVHFDFDIIQAVAAGGEFLVGIVDPFLPEGVVHKVEIDTCIVRTDGLHQGMDLFGIAGIGGKDDGNVAHWLNSLYLQCFKFCQSFSWSCAVGKAVWSSFSDMAFSNKSRCSCLPALMPNLRSFSVLLMRLPLPETKRP